VLPHFYQGFAEDLTEGKYSFPVIHAVQTSSLTDLNSPGMMISSILHQKTQDIGLKKYAISLMGRTGSFQYTLSRMRTYETQLRDCITAFGGNEILLKVVDYLCQTIPEDPFAAKDSE
jgi:geranylgeranyl diphosphate synthase type 3